MAENKFDADIFASTAVDSELAAFPDVNRGWGFMHEDSKYNSSMEFLNGAFNRVDKNIHFIMENSIVEFQADTDYSIDNLVKYNGKIWRCVKSTIKNLPVEGSEYWVEYITGSEYIKTIKSDVKTNTDGIVKLNSDLEDHKKSTDHPDASTSSKGFVKLNNNTNSTSTSEAATANAVKVAYDKGVEALNKANSFTQNLASNGWTKLPNGLLIQWGSASGIKDGSTYPSDLSSTISFPISFSQCFSVSATPFHSNLANGQDFSIDSIGNSSFKAAFRSSYGTQLRYIAIGK